MGEPSLLFKDLGGFKLLQHRAKLFFPFICLVQFLRPARLKGLLVTGIFRVLAWLISYELPCENK